MERETTSSDDQLAGLGPPQFSLATLLIVFTTLSLIFACYHLLGGAAAFVLALFIVAIAAHVAGNSLGTRLRDMRAGQRQPAHSGTKERGQVAAEDLAPVTNLYRSNALGSSVFVCTTAGCVVGLLGGLVIFVFANWEKASWSGSGMGVGAFVFLGGFFGFLISGFFHVGIDALKQAQETSQEREVE